MSKFESELMRRPNVWGLSPSVDIPRSTYLRLRGDGMGGIGVDKEGRVAFDRGRASDFWQPFHGAVDLIDHTKPPREKARGVWLVTRLHNDCLELWSLAELDTFVSGLRTGKRMQELNRPARHLLRRDVDVPIKQIVDHLQLLAERGILTRREAAHDLSRIVRSYGHATRKTGIGKAIRQDPFDSKALSGLLSANIRGVWTNACFPLSDNNEGTLYGTDLIILPPQSRPARRLDGIAALA